MKHSWDPPVGTTSRLQGSAAARPRAPAAPASRVTSAAARCSDGVPNDVITSTNKASFALPVAGRGAAVAKSSVRGKECSQSLVTRSATAQKPPGVILTKQMLVRLKPCPTDRSNTDSSSSSGLGSTGSSRDGRVISTVKDGGGRRHNDSGRSSCAARSSPQSGASIRVEQADEAVTPVGLPKTRGETTSLHGVTTIDKGSAPAAGAPTAARGSRRSTCTDPSARHDTTRTSAAATGDTVARQWKRPQASSGKISSSAEGGKVQEAEGDGDSPATAAAVSVSNTRAKEPRMRNEASAKLERVQQQHVQQDAHEKPERSQPPLQQRTREQQPQQQHAMQQQHAIQQQVLSEETHSTKKELAHRPKADGATKAKPKTKVVVRLLPPSVTEEELLALVTEELKKQITWRKFYPGSHLCVRHLRTRGAFEKSTRTSQQKNHNELSSAKTAGDGGSTTKTSVWFLNCTSPAAAEELIKTFHSKCFVDERHTTFKAIAGLAPYQKTPRKKATEKRLEGQIEEEPLYVSFLENLKDGGGTDESTAHIETEQLEILRDDEGAPITAMLLEMRERYNVKTTVNGRLYTLAMWRENLSFSQGEGTHG